MNLMTSKESYAAYEAVLNEKNPIDIEAKERWSNASAEEKKDIVKRQNDWAHEHNKRVQEARKNLIPEVGTKCTIIYYSDRRAATVTKVISNTKIEVMHNKVKCLDYYGGKYEISPDLEPGFGVDVFTKRRNGLWVEEGQKSKDGVLLSLTHQSHYIDPHF